MQFYFYDNHHDIGINRIPTFNSKDKKNSTILIQIWKLDIVLYCNLQQKKVWKMRLALQIIWWKTKTQHLLLLKKVYMYCSMFLSLLNEMTRSSPVDGVMNQFSN